MTNTASPHGSKRSRRVFQLQDWGHGDGPACLRKNAGSYVVVCDKPSGIFDIKVMGHWQASVPVLPSGFQSDGYSYSQKGATFSTSESQGIHADKNR